MTSNAHALVRQKCSCLKISFRSVKGSVSPSRQTEIQCKQTKTQSPNTARQKTILSDRNCTSVQLQY